MPYTYLEHGADVGIRSEGRRLEEAIEAGAEAMLGVMFDLDSVRERIAVTIRAQAPTPELLFVEVLNEILSRRDMDGLALRRLKTSALRRVNDSWRYEGTAYGETLDIERHGVKTEVKAATYHGLAHEVRADGGHVLRCVLDV